MRIRWRNFELPSKVQPDTETLTTSTAVSSIEPFERGFGTRSATACGACCSPRSRAPPSPRCGSRAPSTSSRRSRACYEDVTDIILNIKSLRIRYDGDAPRSPAASRKSGKGAVTGADVECDRGTRGRQPGPRTSARSRWTARSTSSSRSRKGRGYVPAEDNRREDQRARHDPGRRDLLARAPRAVLDRGHARRQVHELRPARARDLDRRHRHARAGAGRGRQDLPQAPEPVRALRPEPGRALRSTGIPRARSTTRRTARTSELPAILDRPIADLELSVRARNCLDSANLQTLARPRLMSETEVMNLKNLGQDQPDRDQDQAGRARAVPRHDRRTTRRTPCDTATQATSSADDAATGSR